MFESKRLVRGEVTVLLLTGFLGVGCVIEAPAPLEHEALRVLEHGFPAAASLELVNLAGIVTIERHDGDLEIEAAIHAAADSDEEAETLVHSLDLAIEENDGRVVVVARYPVDDHRRYYYRRDRHASGMGLWLGVSRTTVRYQGQRITVTSTPRDAAVLWVDFTIRAPEGIDVEIANRVGTIEATDFRGSLNAGAASGDIHVAGGGGDLLIDTGSGDVSIDAFNGDVRAETGSGDVEVSKTRGSVWADTGSGDIYLTDVEGETISASTGSGDIVLAAVAGTILCETGSGDVDGEAVRVGERLIAGTGSGRVTFEADLSAAEAIRLETGSGDIDLRLLDGVPSLHLVVATSSGDIDVRLPGLQVIERQRRRLEARTDGGEVPVEIRTSSGDIRVRAGS